MSKHRKIWQWLDDLVARAEEHEKHADNTHDRLNNLSSCATEIRQQLDAQRRDAQRRDLPKHTVRLVDVEVKIGDLQRRLDAHAKEGTQAHPVLADHLAALSDKVQQVATLNAVAAAHGAALARLDRERPSMDLPKQVADLSEHVTNLHAAITSLTLDHRDHDRLAALGGQLTDLQQRLTHLESRLGACAALSHVKQIESRVDAHTARMTALEVQSTRLESKLGACAALSHVKQIESRVDQLAAAPVVDVTDRFDADTIQLADQQRRLAALERQVEVLSPATHPTDPARAAALERTIVRVQAMAQEWSRDELGVARRYGYALLEALQADFPGAGVVR